MATTLRSIRIDDLVWARWQAAALAEGISLSEWIRRAADRALPEQPPRGAKVSGHPVQGVGTP